MNFNEIATGGTMIGAAHHPAGQTKLHDSPPAY